MSKDLKKQRRRGSSGFLSDQEAANKLLTSLAVAQTALSHFDENRNPVHMTHDTNIHTIGLLIQGKENCEAAFKLIDELCRFLQERGRWMDLAGQDGEF